MSEKGEQGECKYTCSCLLTENRSFDNFLCAGGGEGTIYLRKDNYLVKIYCYQVLEEKGINYIIDSFTPLAFFYRPEFNVENIANTVITEIENGTIQIIT